jgi:hypothetical protein
MGRLEAQIRDHLRDSGIKCQSVYRLPDADENRVVLAFNSKDNQRLSTRKIERTLNNLGIGQFSTAKEFQRLSAAFLHLEVVLGARTEQPITQVAQ